MALWRERGERERERERESHEREREDRGVLARQNHKRKKIHNL
jgi:hypothetical protein